MRMSSVLLVVTLSFLSASDAWAHSHVKVSGGGRYIDATVEKQTKAPGAPPRPRVNTSRGSAPAAPKPIITRTDNYIQWDHRPNGGGVLRYQFSERDDHCRGSVNMTVCYGPEPDDRPARRQIRRNPPVSPQQVVERTIVNVQLPQPQPNVDPGYAVTGMRAYLETGNSTTHTFDPISTVLGPLSITASSTYTVDWGDGTVTGPHSTSGGKYPDGDITHVYKDSAVVTITVTQNWTAQWSLAGQSGTITGLVSSGSLPDFAVREVQAVRKR